MSDIKIKRSYTKHESDFQSIRRNERFTGIGDYVVSDTGIVRNFRTGRIVSSLVNQRGYSVVSLNPDGKIKTLPIHRLVAIAFAIPKPDPCSQCEVHHRDHHKQNNRVDNLVWLSAKDHRRHHADARAKHTTRPKRMGRPRNRNVVAVQRTATQSRVGGTNNEK